MSAARAAGAEAAVLFVSRVAAAGKKVPLPSSIHNALLRRLGHGRAKEAGYAGPDAELYVRVFVETVFVSAKEEGVLESEDVRLGRRRVPAAAGRWEQRASVGNGWPIVASGRPRRRLS